MINPTVISTNLNTASLKLANLTLANVNTLQSGGLYVDWKTIVQAQQAVDCVGRQYSLGDYGSLQFLQAWSCMNFFIGNYAPGYISPNAQLPSINIINVLVAPAPIPYISYNDFDPASQQSDGGRNVYKNANWINWNPVLSLISPSETALTVGTDYTINSQGGITLLGTSTVLPYIYPGGAIRSVSYVQA